MEKDECSTIATKGKQKYVKSIEFAVGWTKQGAKQDHKGYLIDQDLNQGCGGKYIYGCLTYTDDENDALSGLCFVRGVIMVDQPPEGYTKIDQNLNEGAKNKRIYLCFSKGGPNKITDINFHREGNFGPAIKTDTYGEWNVLHPEINQWGGGKYVYLLYKN